MTVEELKELSRTAQARVVFNKGIPALSDALDQMRTQLHDFEREIDMNKVDLKGAKRAGNAKVNLDTSTEVPPGSEVQPQHASSERDPVSDTRQPTAEKREVAPPKTPVEAFGTGRGDPRDTLAEKYRRRKLYGPTKSKAIKKKPSSSWRQGDDLGCPKSPGEGCCEDDGYTPYPKWWDHPADKSTKKKPSKRGAHTLDFALPFMGSYVHNPNVTEEDCKDREEDEFNVYDYLYTKYEESPAPVRVPRAARREPAGGDSGRAEKEEKGSTPEHEAMSAPVNLEEAEEEEPQVQKSMGAFYNDHWMQYFVDKHSGSPAAFERMEAGSSAEGSSAAVLSELSKPFANKLEYASGEFNGEDDDEEISLNPKGNWRYLKGKEYQYGGWVGEYDFTEKGRKPIKDWVRENRGESGSSAGAAKTSGGVKWDFDEILAL